MWEGCSRATRRRPAGAAGSGGAGGRSATIDGRARGPPRRRKSSGGPMSAYIRWYEEVDSGDVATVGGKNASLGE
jgi:hypothetical protein